MKILTRYLVESILALFAVVVSTTFILLVSGAPLFTTYYYLFKGSLGSWIKLTQVIQVWVPLTLCASGLLYTFRIDLWNIGVEGQIMLGAVFTTAVLRIGAAKSMPVFFIGLSLLAGIFGGAIWAVVAGILKTKGGVNEIFAGLGLNFVGQGIILWLIFGPWRRPGIASMSGTEIFPQKLWLPFFQALRISPVGLVLALAALFITALFLRYARLGLNLKAIGNNRDAAYLFGLKPERYMIIAMIFAGGLAGLAGGIQAAGVYHRLLPAISSNYGYLALLIVMLSNYNVWITPLVAFFFACLNVGSIQLPMMLQLDSSLSGVIQGALVLVALAVYAWRVHGKTAQGMAQR